MNFEKIDDWFLLILRERLGLDFRLLRKNDEVELSLANSQKKLIITEIEPAFYLFANTEDIHCTKWKASTENLEGVIHDELFLPYAKTPCFPLFEEVEEGYKIKYDILGLVYWILNRLEEVNSTHLDKFYRFDPKKSHAYLNGYLQRPIVDEWFDILEQIIKRVWRDITIKKHTFSFFLSHDVDRPARYTFKTKIALLKSIASDVKQGYIVDALRAPFIRGTNRNTLSSMDPYNTFEWLFSISEKFNIKNAFYFIAGGNTPYDADYRLSYPQIQALLKSIVARGHEIGLHPSFDTYTEPTKLEEEFIALKDACTQLGIHQEKWGGRMHYLRWSHPDTLQAWENAGLDYDSSLGYSNVAGFRCGTCFEFTPFNPMLVQLLKLKERPLIVMEGMLLQDLSLTSAKKEAVQNEIFSLINMTKKVKGQFTFLWHNSTLRNPLSRELYTEVLEELVK